MATQTNRHAIGYRLLVGGGVIALDQLTKWLAYTGLHRPIMVIPGWLEWVLVTNTGAAYSLLDGHRWWLVGISLVVIGMLLRFHRWLGDTAWTKWGLVFFISGAIGNLIDRVFHGFVIDFIQIYWIPVFNVADMAINIGMGCLIAEWVLVYRQSSSSTSS